jgi:hypothetical protein
MPGQKTSLFRKKLSCAPLPVAVLAALFAGTSTLVIWQSPRNIVADVKPLIMEFGRSKVQSSNDQIPAAQNSALQGQAGSNETADDDGSYRRSREPVRTERSNGGLVLEWPQQKTKASDEASDAKTQAKKILEEAQDYLLVGDLRRALTSARLAYSYPVKWESGEQSPEELLTKLEALAADPTFVASARRQAISRINSANTASQTFPDAGTARLADNPVSQNSSAETASTQSASSIRPGSIVNSLPDRQTGIGVWNPAPPAKGNVESANSTNNQTASSFHEAGSDSGTIEMVAASETAERDSTIFPVLQPYQSQPSVETGADAEPRRLIVDTHRQVSESTAEFASPSQFGTINQVEPRPLIITDQRTAAAAASPIGVLTFDVLATLTTIFAVLFFGSLFLLLAVLAVGKKLIGEKGIGFRIELVNNSPLTIQTGAAAPAAAPAAATSSVADELKIDPDFEGILSLSEQRARQRESAILQQFIENNVSLHNEIGAGRAAA